MHKVSSCLIVRSLICLLFVLICFLFYVAPGELLFLCQLIALFFSSFFYISHNCLWLKASFRSFVGGLVQLCVASFSLWPLRVLVYLAQLLIAHGEIPFECSLRLFCSDLYVFLYVWHNCLLQQVSFRLIVGALHCSFDAYFYIC